MANELAGIDKVANLLAVLVVKDMNKSTAAAVLATAGFSNKEIAGLLGTSEGSVRSFISMAKRKAEKPDKSDKSNDG
ncbi:sigma-70 region 4 domain-containing protein [Microbacterium candidum]|uniref:Sigma-70 region 4 domain-containing protein n=1 Tax=Microbacterium candidum TaxID=3041922 RepID=A0ABT7MX76_9MICO|nr:sigma-70 region 4 domain-containing protein [Microbacterium sp. ASV49]MDL9979036.1 sigma-70 region 4 domain-containing protein [Microbacterium sp. ASV49]